MLKHRDALRKNRANKAVQATLFSKISNESLQRISTGIMQECSFTVTLLNLTASLPNIAYNSSANTKTSCSILFMVVKNLVTICPLVGLFLSP